MDANRFDTLARTLTGTRSRRSAIGSMVASSVLGALGLGQGTPARVAAQGDSDGPCVLDFQAILHEGPNANRSLAPGGSPGTLQGKLRFSVSLSGSLEDADLLLTDGTSLPVVGQAAGHGIQARINLGQGQALVAVGVGEEDVARCLGRLDGTATSTEIGDLGEWHAVSGIQEIPGGSGQAGGTGNRLASGANGSSDAAQGGNRPVTAPGGTGNGTGGSTNAPSQQNSGNGTNGSSPATEGSANSEPALACPEGQTRCSGACVNPTNDVFNCGACGRLCALEEECSGGRCVATDGDTDDEQVTCPAGQTRCGETCTDLQTDETNCGACGTACAAGEECVAGTCTPPAPVLCPEGQVRCDGVCKDALPNFGTQGLSCPGGGAAPTECPAGRVVCNGACFPEGTCQPTECAPGWGYCYGLCRDFQNDPGYCGGCSTGCTGGAYCREGRCFYCSDEFTPCGDKCIDTRTDLDNCGTCGNRCGTQCIDGQCTAVGPSPLEPCAEGLSRCGTACVNLKKDMANCGRCGTVCTSPEICAETGSGVPPAVCHIPDSVCIEQFGGLRSCMTPEGSRCVDFNNDPRYCGDCGTNCGPGGECREGRCSRAESSATARTLTGEDIEAPTETESVESEDEPAFTCPDGQTDCGGVCADLSFDEYNCGSCGFVCGSDSLCERGVCAENTPPAAAPEEEGITEATVEEVVEAPVPDEAAPACVEVGGTCDPASPGACCSGVCNEDGTCA